MADEKLNTGPGEEKLPEAPAPVTADGPQTSAPVTADGPQAPAPVTADEPQAPAPEQAAAPTPQQEGPAQPEPGDVVVSFDKINELMNEKRQTARAEVEKEEAAKEPEEKTQEEPSAVGDGEPKKARRGRPPKEENAEPAGKEAAKPRKGRPPKADKAAPGEATPTKRDKLSRSGKKAAEVKAAPEPEKAPPENAAPAPEQAPPEPAAPPRPVEEGKLVYLCIKDMSRMGRDYLKVGQIMEILRQRGVRLIAINDGVDSAKGDDDFTPFRNIMNEYYARDTSRKIRSTFQSKGKSGKHLTGTVIYGYLWNEARDQWLVDPEAADVVKRIFAMTIDGYGPYQIASKLKSEKVLIPSAYLAQHGEGVNKNKTFKDVYGWGSSTICNILEKREYLGHTINFKTRKHFKDKKSHYVPEDEWTIFENTHEAIIDQQTFDLVQKIRGNVRRYPDGWGEAAPLTGLLYCADCGGKMYVHRTNNGKRISQYTCSQYSKVPVGKLCTTQHRINEDVVLSLVSEMLKAIAEYAKHDRAEFVRVVQEAQSSQQTAEVRKQRTRLATAKQRVSELEVLLCKIYEDNILGKLSDSRYATLDAQYEKEQSELTAEISVLEKAVKSYEKHEKDADRFIALIGKYENFDKLTIAMLNEFIEKILVHERDRKGSIQTTQEVEIYFNFVGRFVPPAFGEVELTPEELEEIRKREERKDRLHQNYLKRKASGAQKRYEDKIKERKKAEIEAKKAAIRAEDIAKGVFVPVSSLPQREPMKGVQSA